LKVDFFWRAGDVLFCCEKLDFVSFLCMGIFIW